MKIRSKTSKAIAKGKIKKTPCAVCGTEENIQVHHLDYKTHDNIVFLCMVHHQEVHGSEISKRVEWAPKPKR